MSLNQFHQAVYNHYLYSIRSANKVPFTPRKDFDTFEKDEPEKCAKLVRLFEFLKDINSINLKLYFLAPYDILTDKKFFDLDFYRSMQAIKLYKLYLQKIDEGDPDSESQLTFIKDSLIYIKDFCVQNNISLMEYLSFSSGLTFAWASQLREHLISFYAFLGFLSLEVSVQDILYEMPSDEQEMLVGEFISNFDTYVNKLKKSKVAKPLVIGGIKKINKIIDDHLKSAKQESTIKQ